MLCFISWHDAPQTLVGIGSCVAAAYVIWRHALGPTTRALAKAVGDELDERIDERVQNIMDDELDERIDERVTESSAVLVREFAKLHKELHPNGGTSFCDRMTKQMDELKEQVGALAPKA